MTVSNNHFRTVECIVKILHCRWKRDGGGREKSQMEKWNWWWRGERGRGRGKQGRRGNENVDLLSCIPRGRVRPNTRGRNIERFPFRLCKFTWSSVHFLFDLFSTSVFRSRTRDLHPWTFSTCVRGQHNNLSIDNSSRCVIPHRSPTSSFLCQCVHTYVYKYISQSFIVWKLNWAISIKIAVLISMKL